MNPIRTKVAIIGGGPAGLLLSHCLDRQGIDNVVMERRSRAHVQSRIRAGILSSGSVQFLRDQGLAANLDRHGRQHDGVMIQWQGKPDWLIDTRKYAGHSMIAYGQTALTRDLYAAREADGAQIFDNAGDVTPCDVETDAPYVTFRAGGRSYRVDCDFVCACDGFHGIGRQTIPAALRKEYHVEFPLGWLGVMVEKPPLEHFIYSHHERGFALAAQRSPMLSRYYIQVPDGTDIADWDDDRFWAELKARFPAATAAGIRTGPTIEKSIAPLRAFVCETMRHGRLYLCGDAAHIFPPTGAKGLNLAISDVYYMQRALAAQYADGNDRHLAGYPAVALAHVWSAMQLSLFLTRLLHRFPGRTPFEQRLQDQKYDHLLASDTAKRWLCELYAGHQLEN